MRRQDRQITDFQEMINVIEHCDVCRIAIGDQDVPYIVPLNFGYEVQGQDVIFYFHSANEGKKLDLLKNQHHVSFEMDWNHELYYNETKKSCTMGYESLIGHGDVTFIEDEDQKYKALQILMKHYYQEDKLFDKAVINMTTVFQLKVKEMTGKRRVIKC